MSSLVLELQRLCIDSSHEITDLLRQALLVASKLKLEDFKLWINSELNGYQENAKVPEYRMITCNLQVINPMRGPIPLIMEPKLAEMLTHIGISAPIASLSALKRKADDGTSNFAVPFSEEMRFMLMQNMGSPVPMEPIRTASSNQVEMIIDGVRSALLKWALALEEEGIMGEGMTFSDEEKKKAAHSTHIHIGSIANLQGIVGSITESTITQDLEMTIKSNDWDSLSTTLREKGISKTDLQELKAALQTDPAPTKPDKFGPAVSAWTGKMLGKAASGAWDISLKVAGSLIATAIASYYGIGKH
jgi:hypothetical protein